MEMEIEIEAVCMGRKKQAKQASDNPSEGGGVGLGNVPRSWVFFTFKVGGFQIYDILLTAHGCHQRVVIRFPNIRPYIYYIKLHTSI